MPTTVVFPTRFNGPPTSAHGGYAAGVVAQLVDAGIVEVTLRRPPPLGQPLTVDGATIIGADGETIASAARSDEPIDPDPYVAEIPADSPKALPDERHPFRDCFGCGFDRTDGLAIFGRRLPDSPLLADHWTPDESLAVDGRIPSEIVWAALDCPGGWAAYDRIPDDHVAVLGRMAGQILRLPELNEPCVVVASSRWGAGRKIDAHTTLYTTAGELLAASRHVWVDITPAR